MLSFFAFLNRHFYIVCFDSAQQTNSFTMSICEDVERSRNVKCWSIELEKSKYGSFDSVKFTVVERSRNDNSRISEHIEFQTRVI
jgi:hypothetical protein